MKQERIKLDPERYISTGTLALLLGVCERSLWRRIKAGVIPPPSHPGKPHLFDVDAVIRHAERTDPFLSCALVGERARVRAYREQAARVRQRSATDDPDYRL